MKIRTVIGLTGATAASCVVGAIALSAPAAYGAPAVHPPATDLPVIYPSPDPTGELPPPGSPGLTVTGNCPSYLFGNAVGFEFQGGNAVFYRIPPGQPPGNSNGGNVEGTADLMIATPGVPPSESNQGTPPSNPVDSGYSGHTHLWFGTNSNANGQSYFGETISFQGTAPNGATIKLTANPGSNTSVSGNTNDWGKLDITCTGTPNPLPAA